MSLSFEPEMRREGTGDVFKRTVKASLLLFHFAMKRSLALRAALVP
jgi:hypothetical protein